MGSPGAASRQRRRSGHISGIQGLKLTPVGRDIGLVLAAIEYYGQGTPSGVCHQMTGKLLPIPLL